MMYRDSNDPKVAQAGVEVRTGWEQRAAKAVLQAELRIHHRVCRGGGEEDHDIRQPEAAGYLNNVGSNHGSESHMV